MRRTSDRPWIIAHRGASKARRENTLDAFRHAADLGADAVELDVRRTRDGAAVVHHDAALPGDVAIVTMHLEEVRSRYSWVPTLDEALAACAGMWINAEIKNHRADPDWDPTDRLVETVVRSIGEDADRILISSFNEETVARGRALGARTAILVSHDGDLSGAADDAVDRGHQAVHPHMSLLGADPAEAIATLHQADLAVNTWTVDDPETMHRLAVAGIDGIITNRPDLASMALG
jgi:glycerophosphoryl diester phosphodiesterase